MKNFINTAKVEYTVNGQRRELMSNSWVISTVVSDNTLKGRVVCCNNCKRWVLKLINKTSGNLIYSMQGVHSRNFSFNVNPDKEYIVEFVSDPECTLRLYNTPDVVSDIRWNCR